MSHIFTSRPQGLKAVTSNRGSKKEESTIYCARCSNKIKVFGFDQDVIKLLAGGSWVEEVLEAHVDSRPPNEGEDTLLRTD